ncbi:hypothetical protein ACRQ5Q_11500 [Bradyrhizobium sp. PMVTL-01]|uniref:hypothetical protein n=1 Tax=Bradyrhizobium sp. PMVTL-01 TaxID=3434999 RepID=UPI003F6F5382
MASAAMIISVEDALFAVFLRDLHAGREAAMPFDKVIEKLRFELSKWGRCMRGIAGLIIAAAAIPARAETAEDLSAPPLGLTLPNATCITRQRSAGLLVSFLTCL